LPDRRIWADDEASLILVFEFDFEFAGSAFDFEIVLVADFEKALAQGFKSCVALFLKFVLVHRFLSRPLHYIVTLGGYSRCASGIKEWAATAQLE
jgi:hypothetical protein